MKRAMWMAVVATVLGVVGGPLPASAAVSNGWDHRTLSVSGDYDSFVGNFGGDSATDILWWPRTGDGPPNLWLGQQGQRGSTTFLKSAPDLGEGTSISQWFDRTIVVGDFAGDEATDVFFYGKAGYADYLFTGHLGGNTFDHKRYFASGTFKPTVLHDDHPGAKDDILFYAPGSGGDYVWHFDDAGSGTFQSRSMAITNPYTVIPGDWNGDGLDDVVLYAPGTAADHKWVSKADGTFTNSAVTVNGRYVAMAVHRAGGDGIFWWSNGPGSEAYWRSNGTTFANVAGLRPSDLTATLYPSIDGTVVLAGTDVWESTFYDSGTSIGYGELDPDIDYGVQIPLVGDFDHDGETLDAIHADIAWYGPRERGDALWYGDETTAPAAVRTAGASSSTPALTPAPRPAAG
jgi:hypothetical protein